MTTVGINKFVCRQTRESRFTWTTHSFERVAEMARESFENAMRGHGAWRPGYRDGVVQVPVNPEGFFTPIVEVTEDDVWVEEWKSRREGEDPRKVVMVERNGRPDSPCGYVEVIMYRKDVMAENGENSTDCDWEVVSINGRMTPEPEPMRPEAMEANHRGKSGGTATGWTEAEFEKNYAESVAYWNKYAMMTPKEVTS